MSPHPMTSRAAAIAGVIACVAALSACAQANSEQGASAGLRDWLAATHEGDEAACALVTRDFRRELLAESERTGGAGRSCRERVAAMSDSLPAPDSAMDVPVWDPSGEALVEVTDAGSGRVVKFWMLLEDGTWLVAGEET